MRTRIRARGAGADGYLLEDTRGDGRDGGLLALFEGKHYFGPEATRAIAEGLRDPGEIRPDPYQRLTRREREVFHSPS